jgi:hypothetical protein
MFMCEHTLYSYLVIFVVFYFFPVHKQKETCQKKDFIYIYIYIYIYMLC